MTIRPDISHGYKVLTHRYTSPLQGSEALCDGMTFPVMLPAVTLDTSSEECAAGWNYCATIHEALQIAGLWPDGYPSRVFEVIASGEALQRGSKRRTSCLTLIRECHEEEIAEGITTLSQAFAPHTQRMIAEQLAWREALRRPRWNKEVVAASLQQAVALRDLSWTVQEYATIETVWTVWSAQAAWAVWNARDMWGAQGAQAAWDMRDTQDPRDMWETRGVRGMWGIWAASAAQDALTHFFVTLQQWMPGAPWQYTAGIREAYSHGLAVAIPLAGGVLGWAMIEHPQETVSPDRSLP